MGRELNNPAHFYFWTVLNQMTLVFFLSILVVFLSASTQACPYVNA